MRSERGDGVGELQWRDLSDAERDHRRILHGTANACAMRHFFDAIVSDSCSKTNRRNVARIRQRSSDGEHAVILVIVIARLPLFTIGGQRDRRIEHRLTGRIAFCDRGAVYERLECAARLAFA